MFRRTRYSEGSVRNCHNVDGDTCVGPSGRLNSRPVFVLDVQDEGKPVYEAWNFHGSLSSNTAVSVAGLEVFSRSTFRDRGQPNPVTAKQSELAKMHLDAVEAFYNKHRRGWTSRAFRRKGKTYERDLDDRCRKLPLSIREGIQDLLETREWHSSTSHSTRKWKVVAMQARERHRFSQLETAEAKRRRLFGWGKNSIIDMLDYMVVIQGIETRKQTGDKPITRFAPESNPWDKIDRQDWNCTRVDLAWYSDGDDDETQKYEGESRSPSPPSYRGRRRHSRSSSDSSDGGYRSPPSYRPARDISSDRSRSPSPSPPSYRPTRDPSLDSEPDAESQARRYIRLSRAAGRGVPPPAPEPPRRRTFSRRASRADSRSPSPYVERPFIRPHVSYDEDTMWTGRRYTVEANPSYPTESSYAPQHFGFPAYAPYGPPHWVENDEFRECAACENTPNCGHFPPPPNCVRPMSWAGETASHPPCFICMATSPPDAYPQRDFSAPPPPPPPPPPVPASALSAQANSPSLGLTPRVIPPNGTPLAEDGNETTDFEIDDDDEEDEDATVVEESSRPKNV